MLAGNPYAERCSNMNDDARLKQLQTVQTLNMVAFIAGPVSLLIGGVLLSGVALACAIVAVVKVKAVVASEESKSNLAESLRKQSIVAVAIAAVVLGINLVWFATMLIAVFQIAQSGDFSQLAEMLGAYTGGDSSLSGDASSGGSQGSIWD